MSKSSDWDREKKVHKVEKGTNKAGKHRKSIYNMLSEEEDDFDSDESDYLDYEEDNSQIQR